MSAVPILQGLVKNMLIQNLNWRDIKLEVQWVQLTNQKKELPSRPCLLMDRDTMSILYKGPSINASYQVSVHLAQQFQRRMLKCENERTTDGKSSCGLWHGLTLANKVISSGQSPNTHM